MAVGTKCDNYYKQTGPYYEIWSEERKEIGRKLNIGNIPKLRIGIKKKIKERRVES